MCKKIFVIGLLKSLSRKFMSDCSRNGLNARVVLADIGKEGTFTLLPRGQDAKHALHAYLEKLDTYEDCFVIVLPYADLTAALEEELTTLSELGSTIIRPQNGQNGWPLIKQNKWKKPDTKILNAVYEELFLLLPIVRQEVVTSVSDHFRSVLDSNNRIRIFDDVFNHCDRVAPHRREFMKKAIDSLSEFIELDSQISIGSFFKERGIEHAQTGGIQTTIKIFHDGREVFRNTSSVHLKKGDKTTPEGAARIYYQIFSFNDVSYLALIYAGPHPDSNVDCSLEI